VLNIFTEHDMQDASKKQQKRWEYFEVDGGQ
jgi:hypothetical protein